MGFLYVTHKLFMKVTGVTVVEEHSTGRETFEPFLKLLSESD